MNKQNTTPDGRTLSFKFDPSCGLSSSEQSKIETLFGTFAERLLGFGLTHAFYRSVSLDSVQGEVFRCDLMYADAAFIDLYYEQNLGPMFSAMCQSQPPYQIAFFPTPDVMISDRYQKVIEAAVRCGMYYDFFYQFRDCPIAGGGLSGGRKGEKLSKQSLYAAFGAGVEFHKTINRIFAVAAERQFELTDNELKYLQLLFYGMSQKEIAAQSNVSRNWVAKTCMSIRRKLGVDSNVAAIAKAVGLGILN